MAYPEQFIAPMRAELTRVGARELRSPADVDAAVKSSGTVMVVVNSFAAARQQGAAGHRDVPAHAKKPDPWPRCCRRGYRGDRSLAGEYFAPIPLLPLSRCCRRRAALDDSGETSNARRPRDRASFTAASINSAEGHLSRPCAISDFAMMRGRPRLGGQAFRSAYLRLSRKHRCCCTSAEPPEAAYPPRVCISRSDRAECSTE